jgi:hypothetical protein
MESFTWKEYGSLGEELLEESGPRFGVGFAFHKVFGSGLALKPRAEFFGGSVDYDGATQAGVPVSSETDYFGFKGEFDLGGQIGNKVIFEPFAGIGLRGWDRDINDSTTVTGTPAIGYTEQWFMSYLRIGLRLLSPPSVSFRGYFELGARVPLHTENTVLLSEKFPVTDVTLEPGNKTSFFAEGGFRTGGFKMTLFYETLRFKESPPELEPVSGFYFYQPRSEADIYGVRVGAAF